MTLYVNDHFFFQISSWMTMLLWGLFFYTSETLIVYIQSHGTLRLSHHSHTHSSMHSPVCEERTKVKPCICSTYREGSATVSIYTWPSHHLSDRAWLLYFSHATEPTLDGALWQPTDLLLLNLDSLVVWNGMESLETITCILNSLFQSR